MDFPPIFRDPGGEIQLFSPHVIGSSRACTISYDFVTFCASTCRCSGKLYDTLEVSDSLENWESKRTSTGTDGRENPTKNYYFIFANAWPEVGDISFLKIGFFFWNRKISKIFIENQYKIFVKNRNFFRKFFNFSRNIYIDFSMKIFGFRKNLKKYFFEIFRKIFWARENLLFSRKKYMKIANLPRNPKITLRKSYDHLKYTKTGKPQLFKQIL